jgi:magnesium-protoporphyrin IX monomethyl ester (oxidative) cyclase
MPKEYVTEVLPRLKTPRDMRIFYEVKADLTRRELSALADAGVTLVQPGIEALATSTLKLMRKGTSSLQNISFLKHCAALGIRPFWNLLIGFPYETDEIYRRYAAIIPLLTHLYPPTGVYPVRFDRFSPYHQNPEMYGVNLYPLEWYSFVYPFDQNDLNEFAYYFADHNSSAEYARAVSDWIGPLRDLVDNWKKRWTPAARQADPPLLSTRRDDGIVIDSRTDFVIERRVGRLAHELLRAAEEPIRAHNLLTRVADHGADTAETLALLLTEGLVLRDGDHVISLVDLSPSLELDTDLDSTISL